MTPGGTRRAGGYQPFRLDLRGSAGARANYARPAVVGYALGLFGLAVVFAAGAVFPEVGWGWVHLWVESDSEIRPTRAYIVYTRVTGTIVAILCAVAGVAVIAVEVARDRRSDRCERIITAVVNAYDADGFISDERAGRLAEEWGVEITVTAGIVSGDAFDVVDVIDNDFNATLFPDSRPDQVCERVAA